MPELSEFRKEAVLAELTHVLESPAFRNSKRCSEFLKYIVEHTIDGPGGNLKERSIGIDLFHLAPDFDTGQHAIVRVTANEVRKKLAQYYFAENGSQHEVRIEVPPGSYSTEFRWEVSAAPPVEAPVIEAPRQWRIRPVFAVAAALVLIAVGALSYSWFESRRASRPAAASVRLSAPLAAAAVGSEDLRLAVGSSQPYTDRNGRIWGPDRFFSGGSVLPLGSERILRTLDPDIYRRFRQGDFRYDIPLIPGSYELHLHFAETALSDFISAESSGEGQRVFHVSINGKQVLDFFDVVADAAGANIADERVFRNISPAADGILHLSFTSIRGAALVSAIELLPVSPGKVRPIRVRAGWPSSWKDSAGRTWEADAYFAGGNALVRNSNPARAEDQSAPPDMALYASERWGHFSYALPVAEGRYRVTLKFCEGHYGPRNTGFGGAGSRLFDVYCNGVALLRDFDIIKQAGGEGRPVERTFPAIRPTAQGKIVLTFVPVKGMACVNAIEIVEDVK